MKREQGQLTQACDIDMLKNREIGSHYDAPGFQIALPLKKATRDQCRKQLSRLNSKYGAPRDKEDEFRLGKVLDLLMAVSESPEHVEKIIDLLEQLDRFPDGHAISRVAFDTRTIETRPNPECTKCFGSGHSSVVMNGMNYAGKCECWRTVRKAGM